MRESKAVVLIAALLAAHLGTALGGCATTSAAGSGAGGTDALAGAPPGAYLTGTFVGLGDPLVVNRRDFVYALAFSRTAEQLAFVHHVSTNMELTATGLAPIKPRFQSPINSSEFDIEDVLFLDSGPGAGLVVVPSRQGLVRAFDATTGALKFEHAVGVALVRVAAPASGAVLAVGAVDGRIHLLDPATFARIAEVKPFSDEVRGLAFVDERRLVAAAFDGKLEVLDIVDGAEPIARLPAGKLKGGERVFLAFLGEPGSTPGRGAGRGISTVRDGRQPLSTVTTQAVKRLKLAPVEGQGSVLTSTGEKQMPLVALGHLGVGVLTLGALNAAVCDECVPVGAELSLGQDALSRATLTDDVANDEVIVKPTEAEGHATVIDNALSLKSDATIALPGPGTDVDVARDGTVVVSFSTTRAERSFDLYEAEKAGDYPEPAATSGAALVDLKKRALVRSYIGHRGFTVTTSISPDGRTVATGGWDKRVLIFDVKTGEQLAERELAWLLRRVRFSPNGKLLGAAAWTPVNALNEGDSDPALLLYPLSLDQARVATR